MMFNIPAMLLKPSTFLYDSFVTVYNLRKVFAQHALMTLSKSSLQSSVLGLSWT